MGLKEFCHMQMSTALREYDKKTEGNGITEKSRSGRALRREDVLELEDVEEKLGIEEPVEIEEVGLERIKSGVQSYVGDLEKAERVLKDQNQDGIAYEVRQVKTRLERVLEDLEDEAGR